MKKGKNLVELNLFEDYENVDDDNLFVGAVFEATERNKGKEPVKQSRKIEDFGEKIGGARKDLYAAYCELVREAIANDVVKMPLSKLFPAPNYQKLLESGIEVWKIDAVRALRDTVPRKPKKYSWLIREWADTMEVLRNMAISVLEDKWTKEEFGEELEKFKTLASEYSSVIPSRKEMAEQIQDKILIYQVMGHEKDCSALKFDRAYSRDNEEDKIKLIEVHGSFNYETLSYGATKLEAIESYKVQDKKEEKAPREKKNPFKVYSWRYSNYYFIGCKIGKEYIEIQSPFEKAEEATAYMSEHVEELEDKLKKYRNIPYERESENTPRTGKMRRTSDVTPDQFQETFGFRGVEFGEWVESKTRQEDLNKTYDALMDMAEVLNLPTRALSLNGSLGLAFGSRGKGGKNAPLAHYEHSKVVINLTKKKGAGSLGHEWFHSLDNYLGKKSDNDAGSMLTQKVNENEAYNVSAEVREAFKLLQQVIRNSGLVERCNKLDKRRNQNYWTLPEEMAARSFESYLKFKLEEKGIHNDYLVNYRDEESWMKATEEGVKMDNTYPYPLATEMEDIRAAYEYLFDSIRFKSHDENYEIYSATSEKVQEEMKESRLLFEIELSSVQKSLQKMSEEVLGIEIRYFEGSPKLHGRYDEDSDIMYLNGKAETSLDWMFWHEAFHIMKRYDPELYDDILKHVESHDVFTNQQIEDYRKSVNQPQISQARVMEEMLADAFADMKTGRRIVEKMEEKNPSLANRFKEFTKKLLNSVRKFFKSKEVQEKYPEVILTNKQFKDFVARVNENICSLQNDRDEYTRESKGYKILQAQYVLNSPYKYAPKKQKKLDTEVARKLSKEHSDESVQDVIQNLSPLGQKNKDYGKEILRGVKSYGR